MSPERITEAQCCSEKSMPSANRKRVKLITSLFFFALFNCGASAEVRAQANFYQGKTLRVVVGSTSGGGYDLWEGLIAQHIGKHSAGHQTVVEQNMRGAC